MLIFVDNDGATTLVYESTEHMAIRIKRDAEEAAKRMLKETEELETRRKQVSRILGSGNSRYPENGCRRGPTPEYRLYGNRSVRAGILAT